METLVKNLDEPLNLSLVHAFHIRFSVHPSRCTIQQSDGSYLATNFAATPQHFLRHLRGQLTLGVYATDEQTERTKWICFDSDLEDGYERLKRLQELLYLNHHWHSLLETSRRGGHLWIFLDFDSQTRDYALRLMDAIREIHYRSKADLFPKPSGMGGCVRLPLGIHRKTGTRFPVYDFQQGKLIGGADALLYIATIEPVSVRRIVEGSRY